MRTHYIHRMIREARKSAGLTQAELAKKSRLDPANIANYETRIIPPIDKLEQIARALKFDLVVEFYNREAQARHRAKRKAEQPT